ncbi:MAG: DUF3999 domain-containing protein [Desulfocapsaceae bacterium]|nr:DUF3999 domain-containing protein [Desulfocapsaceae bacterium]
MKRTFIIILSTLLPTLAIAEEVVKEDFAYGLILNTDNQGAFYGVTLPHDVYVNTALKNLDDLKVFNSDDQVVPHNLRYPPHREEQEERHALPFFPLFSKQKMSDTELSMRIETGSEGEIVNIERNRSPEENTPTAYLIDMEEKERSPASLRLVWNTDGPGKLLPVIVEDSRDLVSWRRVSRSTLADLVFMNNRLQHGEIALPRKTERYLRLRTENNITFPQLTVVEANYHLHQQPSTRRWFNVPFKVEKEDGRIFLELELTNGMVIDGLKMEFDQPNSLLKVRVSSLNSDERRQYQGEGLFYYISDNGNVLYNEPLFFRQHRPTKLILELMEKGIGAELDSTRIFLGYTPQELLFVARGSSPFLLAYGNGNMQISSVEKSSAAFQSLAENNEQNLIRQAEVGQRIILGGEGMLAVPAPNPWKKRILWLVLVGGVAILAAMAWSLTRKMNR